MELMADHWGVWCSAGIVCYCVIVTLRDVKVGLFKCLHKESPYSLRAHLHKSFCGQPRTYGKVYFYMYLVPYA